MKHDQLKKQKKLRKVCPICAVSCIFYLIGPMLYAVIGGRLSYIIIINFPPRCLKDSSKGI